MSDSASSFDTLLTHKEIASATEVEISTSYNWANRYPDFPAAVARVGGYDMFDRGEILQWLSQRRIPRKQLTRNEVHGTTYGDRAIGNLEARDQDLARVRDVDLDSREVAAQAHGLMLRFSRFEGLGVSRSQYLEIAIMLVFTWVCAQQLWERIERSASVNISNANSRTLIDELERSIDAALRHRGLLPGANAALQPLARARTADVVDMIQQCKRIGVRGFDMLRQWLEQETSFSAGGYPTPKEIASLMAACVARPALNKTIVDPYVRGSDLLQAAARSAKETGQLSIMGEGIDPLTLRLAGMSLAVQGYSARLHWGDAYPRTRRADHKADEVLLNPPFNTATHTDLESSNYPWIFGTPPPHNDNYAWLQLAVALLGDNGRAAVLMPDNAAVSRDGREYDIRRAMVEGGVVKALIALPRNLFPVTSVAATLWVLGAPQNPGVEESVLFVDARELSTSSDDRRQDRLVGVTEIADVVRNHVTSPDGRIDEVAVVGLGVLRAARASTAEVRATDYDLSPVNHLDRLQRRHHAEEQSSSGQLGEIQARSTDVAAGTEVAATATAAIKWIDFTEAPAFRTLQSGWRRVRLSELCSLQPGPSHSQLKKAERIVDGGVPILMPKHVRSRRIVAADPERVTRETAHKFDKFTVHADDILLVRTGTISEPAIVGPDQRGWLYSTNLLRLRVKDNALDPWFLLAYLSRESVLGGIRVQAGLNLVPSFSSRALGELEIDLPPAPEQQRIRAALQAIDNQIAAHQRAAKAAEQMRSAVVEGLLSGRVALR